MSTVIKIENLYKEYRLGVIGHGTLYRDLQSWWAKLKGKEDPNTLIGRSNSDRNKEEQILALDDINLEIKDGEVLGIIGANGAGKSTLLKILSRVPAPTKGRIKIRGRIASLLEVGTGFHPELTGRENIYLNGAINGMRNTEVSRKLDEIVDFAGVGMFLDTPVKRYSSGMHVRLGFAGHHPHQSGFAHAAAGKDAQALAAAKRSKCVDGFNAGFKRLIDATPLEGVRRLQIELSQW